MSREAFDGDLGSCVELAGGVSIQRQTVATPNPFAAAAAAFMGGLMAARERRAFTANIMRTCMADRGYRRIGAPKPILAEVQMLEGSERLSRLFELAAQPAAGTELPR